MQITLGANAKAYFLNTGTRATWGAVDAATGLHTGAAPASLTEITSLVDVKIGTGGVSTEATTRGNGNTEAFDYGLEKYSVTLMIRFSKTDAGRAAIAKARASRTGIAMAFLSGDKATAGEEGFWGDWMIDDDSADQPLADGQTVAITLKPWSGSAISPVERVKVGTGS